VDRNRRLGRNGRIRQLTSTAASAALSRSACRPYATLTRSATWAVLQTLSPTSSACRRPLAQPSQLCQPRPRLLLCSEQFLSASRQVVEDFWIFLALVFGSACGNVPVMWILIDCDLYAKHPQT